MRRLLRLADHAPGGTLEWMARRMPELGRVVVQAESELGAINMALGAAATGARVLVSSSSPGISLMAEGMSYLAGSELPMVLINVMRGGPGLGSIGPSQSDSLGDRRPEMIEANLAAFRSGYQAALQTAAWSASVLAAASASGLGPVGR